MEATKQPSEQQQSNMQYGTENKINVIATLVSKILPVYFPDINYVEDGCYLIHENESEFMVVSPDGSQI